MKLNRWLLPAVLTAVLALAGGCKKDNTTEYKELSGNLSLDMPYFLQPGDSKTFMIDTLMTLSCPDGYAIGYYFTDPDTGVRDTLVDLNGIRSHYYTVTAPDKLMDLTLTLTAFVPSDSKYSGTTASTTFVVVRPGVDGKGSITEFDIQASDGVFTDARDGRKYYYKNVGALSWMRQNLAWEGAGAPFYACDAMTDVFGRYYSWTEAQTACPEGWRLPTDAEWTALQDGAVAGKDIDGLAGRLMADLYFNGTKMWEYWREVKISDELGLSAMPVGYANRGELGYDFHGLYSYAAFWTADEAEDEGICRYIYQSQDIVYRGRLSKTDFAASVRCVKTK